MWSRKSFRPLSTISIFLLQISFFISSTVFHACPFKKHLFSHIYFRPLSQVFHSNSVSSFSTVFILVHSKYEYIFCLIIIFLHYLHFFHIVRTCPFKEYLLTYVFFSSISFFPLQFTIFISSTFLMLVHSKYIFCLIVIFPNIFTSSTLYMLVRSKNIFCFQSFSPLS